MKRKGYVTEELVIDCLIPPSSLTTTSNPRIVVFSCVCAQDVVVDWRRKDVAIKVEKVVYEIRS